MKLIDVNLLLYAYDRNSAMHEVAREWLMQTFDASEPTGLTHSTVLAFVRIATSSRVFLDPFGIAEAGDLVADWLSQPNVVLLAPTERHWQTFRDVAVASQSVGTLVPDADLAAAAIEHGATVCTNDRDFSRFAKLRVEYPLARGT